MMRRQRQYVKRRRYSEFGRKARKGDAKGAEHDGLLTKTSIHASRNAISTSSRLGVSLIVNPRFRALRVLHLGLISFGLFEAVRNPIAEWIAFKRL
jgi:predicted exporter